MSLLKNFFNTRTMAAEHTYADGSLVSSVRFGYKEKSFSLIRPGNARGSLYMSMLANKRTF
jgi:hypothetical protein